MNHRWVIAHDEKGYHVRKTVTVTHDGTSGEAIYYTKPMGTRQSLRAAVKLARKVERKSKGKYVGRCG